MTPQPLPAVMLFLALGLAAGAVPKRWLVGAAIAASIGAGVAPLAGWDNAVGGPIYVAGWLLIAAICALVYLPSRIARLCLVTLAGPAGLLAATDALDPSAPARFLLFPAAALIAIPGRWLVAKRWAIGLRIAASWVIAGSLLITALPFGPTIAGYERDHLE